ncbi:hypothetical protein CAEBREN_03358 [Caenorhabditis brenneri]|uniref:Serpentine Receptor, class Z n=1 Tax=Caenorhabditis brenneri TaxID=135651 RepID=G0NQ79_CAEBE|nr:hypothetical protein CAEBREN_03358 [Caenorhabditis brenneri]
MNNTHLAENLKNISKGSLILFYFFAIILIFFGCLVLLPFYVYVNKVNRSRDEKTLVFPITNHFYKMIRVTYVLFLAMLVFVGMTVVLMGKHIYITVFLVLIIFLCYITLSVIFQVFHVFISLLAIQRVILHFFPQTETFIAKNQHKLFKRTWCIYLIFGIKDFISVITYIICLKNDTCDQEKPEQSAKIYLPTNCFYIGSHISFHPDCILLLLGSPSHYLIVLLFLFFVICFIILLSIIQVFHLLISLLAIQRVFLHFFPENEKYLVLIQNYLIKKSWCIYLIFVIKDTINYSSVLQCLQCYQRSHNLIHTIIFLILNGLLYTSAFLYVPIIFNIRKHSYLASFKLNNPQKYIFSQAIFILVFKSASFPIIYFLHSMDYSPELLKFLILLMDVMIIPLIVQISYLFCNRRNVRTLISSVKFLEFMRSSRRDNSVKPMIYSLESVNESVL